MEACKLRDIRSLNSVISLLAVTQRTFALRVKSPAESGETMHASE